MIAEVCQHTGWTWDYTERHICLHRHAALQRLWRRSPPLQTMVQAYLGIEGKDEPPPGSQSSTSTTTSTTSAAPTGLDSPPPSTGMTPEQEAAAIAEFARNFAAAGGAVH